VPLLQYYRCASNTCLPLAMPHGATVPHCKHGRMQWYRTCDHKPEEHGWSTGMRAPAIDFAPSRDRELPIALADGSQMKMESLHQLRLLEKESQLKAASGDGQELRFRNYSMERGNKHVNTFGEPPQRAPKLTRNGKQRISVKALPELDVDASMGPGTDEALASALAVDPV
jgi:hypothetical protein